MRRLIPALLSVSLSFVSMGGVAFGQGHPGGTWSLGGFGSILYPGTGHAPTATPPIGQFSNAGFSHGFANPGRASHPQHGAAVIVPYPVYYGGYYGGGYYGDPSAAGYSNGYAPGYGSGYTDDGSQAGPGLPSVVINQNFVPPQANPQVRDYSGDQQTAAAAIARSIGAEVVPSAAFASLCRCGRRSTRVCERPADHLPDRPARPHHRPGTGLLDGRQHAALRERRAHA